MRSDMMGVYQLISNTSNGYPIWELIDGQHNVTKYIMTYVSTSNGVTARYWMITSDYGKFTKPNSMLGLPFSNGTYGMNATSPTASHVWSFDRLPYEPNTAMQLDPTIKVTESACNGELFFVLCY